MSGRQRCVLLALALGAGTAAGDDIWQRADRRSAYLFVDNRGRNIGDLVTVEVDEATTANEREQRQLEKSSSDSLKANYAGQTAAGATARDGKLDFAASNSTSRQFSGSAQLTADRRFLDRITCTIVDVLPNGNLLLEGYRTRVVEGEQRVLRLTGIVRPADIGSQNTVPSRQIANFKVVYLGRGPETRFVNQGFLSRVANRLWPF